MGQISGLWVSTLVACAMVTSAHAEDRIGGALGLPALQVQDTLVTATRYAGLGISGTLAFERTTARHAFDVTLAVAGGGVTNRFGYEALDVGSRLVIDVRWKVRPCQGPWRVEAGLAFGLVSDVHLYQTQDYTYGHWLTSYPVGPSLRARRRVGRGSFDSRAQLGLLALASRRNQTATYQNDVPEVGPILELVHRDPYVATAWSHRIVHVELAYEHPLSERMTQRIAYTFDYAGDTDPTPLHRLGHAATLGVSYAL